MKYEIKISSIFKNEIVRRYVVSNSFDGALTMLGIIIANFFAGTTNASLVVLPGIGAAIALGISGIWGAYAAEISEVLRKRRGLERHLLVKIGHAKTSKQRNRMAIIIGIVNGATSVLVSFLILVPFFIAKLGLIAINVSYMISLIFIIIVLFGLGIFTGITAKENILRNGLKMLLAGIVIGVIFFILAGLGWI